MIHMNLQSRNRLTDLKKRFVTAGGRWGGRGMDWEFGVSRRKLFPLERMSMTLLCIAQGTVCSLLG